MKSIVPKDILVIGAGGHARVLLEALVLSGREIVGMVDPDKQAGTECFGFRVLGGDDVLQGLNPREIELVNGIGTMPGRDTRWRVASRMRSLGFEFSKVVHPSAIIGVDTVLEPGVQIMAGAIIQPGTRVGVDSIINTGAIVDHDCEIGGCCHLGPGVVLSGNVTVGEYSHIGTGSSIIQGITVGDCSLVAAGSVVYKDIPRNTRYIQHK